MGARPPESLSTSVLLARFQVEGLAVALLGTPQGQASLELSIDPCFSGDCPLSMLPAQLDAYVLLASWSEGEANWCMAEGSRAWSGLGASGADRGPLLGTAIVNAIQGTVSIPLDTAALTTALAAARTELSVVVVARSGTVSVTTVEGDEDLAPQLLVTGCAATSPPG